MVIVCFGWVRLSCFFGGLIVDDNCQWLVVGCDDEQQEMHGCDWFANPSAFLELLNEDSFPLLVDNPKSLKELGYPEMQHNVFLE